MSYGKYLSFQTETWILWMLSGAYSVRESHQMFKGQAVKDSDDFDNFSAVVRPHMQSAVGTTWWRQHEAWSLVPVEAFHSQVSH